MGMLLLVIFKTTASFFFLTINSVTPASSPALFKCLFTWKQSEDAKRPRPQTKPPLCHCDSTGHPAAFEELAGTVVRTWKNST